MGSGDEHWRRVERLEQLRDADELIAVLEEDDKECWHTRTAAIRSLVAVGQGGAAILKTLAREQDPGVREAAIEALGQLRFERARRMLERIAGDDEDPLRQIAAQALTRLY